MLLATPFMGTLVLPCLCVARLTGLNGVFSNPLSPRRHPHDAGMLASSGRVSSAGQSLEVQSTEQARGLGGTPSAPSAMTEQGLEYTFSGGLPRGLTPLYGGKVSHSGIDQT